MNIMKTHITAIVALTACFLAAAPHSQAEQALLAGWNFNSGSDAGVAGKLQPTSGAGTMTTNWGNFFLTSPGSTFNLVEGDPAGYDLGFFNGTTDTTTGLPPNAGRWFQFEVDMSGQQDLHFSYAGRTSPNGMGNLTWSWSIDGINFTNFASVDHVALFGGNTYGPMAFDLRGITALNNQPQVFIRGTITPRAGQTTFGALELTRLDNVQFNALPERATVQLELERSFDLQHWEGLAITPDLLTEDGKLRVPADESSGFFRLRITQ
jgi:hypothetical protein